MRAGFNNNGFGGFGNMEDGQHDTGRQLNPVDPKEQTRVHKELLNKAKVITEYASDTEGAQILVCGGCAGTDNTIKSFIVGVATPQTRVQFVVNLIKSMDPMSKAMLMAQMMGILGDDK